MKKLKVFFTVLFGVSLFALSAQENYSSTWKKLTQYEVDLTSYEKDAEAEALVIYETGNSSFKGNHTTGNFDLHMQRSVKIKILKQSGLKYANFEIPYYIESNNLEEVSELEAYTYNMDNGKITTTPLEKGNIFTEKINDNWSMKVFAMPNVKVGSIIELRYTIISPYIANIREWNFQKKIPVVESTFRLRVTPYYEYAYIMKGSTSFDVSTSEVDNNEKQFGSLTYREVEFTFGKKNIPAFRDVDFISSERDYMISMNFQLAKVNFPRGGHRNIMTSWSEISNEFLKSDYFGKYVKAAEKAGKKILPELKLDGKTADEQVETIVNHVKDRYRWNNMTSKFSTDKVSDFLKDKTGNSADINLYLLGLLNAAKINATPILTSTRGNGQVSERHPFHKFFNYVIIQVELPNGNTYLLDATEPLLKYDKLPNRCNNVRGLVVYKNSEQWVNILQDELALTEKEFRISFDNNLNSQKNEIAYTAYNHDAFMYRSCYDGESDNLKDLLKKRSVGVSGQITTQNDLSLEKPFVFSFQTETPVEKTSDKLFVTPFLNQSVTETIFTQTTPRTQTIDLIHRHAGKYHSTIVIPEGYVVDFMPKKVERLSGNKMNAKYEAIETNGMVEVTAEYEFYKSQYAAEDYDVLKHLFDAIIKRFNEMIVLKKTI